MKKIKICTVITGDNLSVFLTNLTAIQREANFIELRVDYIKNLKLSDINIIAQNTYREAIFTCRHQNEGGKYQGDRNSQLEIIKQAINLDFNYIDLDLEILKSRKINRGNCQLIVSYHDFLSTPSFGKLKEILEQMRETQADVFKIVSMVNKETDNLTLFKLLLDKKVNEKLVISGMGKKGKISRIFSPFLGAYLTFASSSLTSSAPGQISLLRLKEIYQLIEDKNKKSNDQKLDNLRSDIDQIDQLIVDLIAKRMDLVKEVGKYKKIRGIPSLDKTRWKQVLESKKKLAIKCNLNPKLIVDIYNLLHQNALKIEDEVQV